MSTIKHFDGEKWVVDASSNARNIELDNELLLDIDSTSISVERGFQKINNKISKLEHNLAWIYQNGAKGGGGSGSGGGSYTLKIENDQTVFYTTTSKVTFKILITSGGLKKLFKLYAQNITNNTYLISGTLSVYSQSLQEVTLTNLTLDCTVALQAVDNNDNYTDLITILIKVGAMNILMEKAPESTFYIGKTVSILGTFSVRNKIGSAIKLALFKSTSSDPLANLETPVWESTIEATATQFINYYIPYSDYIDKNVLNKTYTFKVCIYSENITNADGSYLRSEYFTNSIQTASSENLAIITNNIGLSPEDAINYSFPLGGICSLSAIFSYLKIDYTRFYYKCQVYHITDIEQLVYESSISIVSRNESSIILILLGDWGIKEGYYKVVIIGNASEDFTNTVGAESSVYFTISEADTGNLENYKGPLIYHYGAFNRPQNTNDSVCSYSLRNEGKYSVNQSMFPRSLGIDKVNLTIHNSTTSTGFIINPNNGVNYINLSGNTYATIDLFVEMLGATDNTLYTLLGNGFYLLCTYKFIQDNPEELTVISLGTYRDGQLSNGFEVSSEKITLRVASLIESIEAPIKGENLYISKIQGTTDQITVGLNCWKATTLVAGGNTSISYYFAVYLDGIMTKCLVVPENELGSNWAFADKLYLGCRGDLTNLSNCYIYDIKLYAAKLPPLSIVYNFMSAIEQSNLNSNKQIDYTLDAILRKKNFFSSTTDTCLLCNDEGEYSTSTEILATLSNSYESYNLDYPIIYIEETSNQSDMYRIVKSTNWTKFDPEIKEKWPVRVNIYTKHGKLVIDGPNDSLRPKVSIQGTSTLAYNIKNFELTMGTLEDGREQLLKINGWLPENEFTLKADVVDSSHSNNAVIGKWINTSGYFSHMASSIENSMHSSNNNIYGKRKYTSEGFPCLVFVKYSNQGAGAIIDSSGMSVGQTDFFGVYNFNLGRYAYNNLNLRVLESYTQDTSIPDDLPQLITLYSIKYDLPKNIYSMEVSDNFDGNNHLLFQLADLNISEYILDNRSYGDINDRAYQCITNTLFTLMAGLYANTTDLIPKCTINKEDPVTPIIKTNSDGTPLYWNRLDNVAKTKEALSYILDVDTLYRYLIVALVFGMVDSTCKNMVLRTWNAVLLNGSWQATWYPCFYDMDSSMILNNAGAQQIPYDVHTNRFYNITVGNLTTAGNSRTTGVTWNYSVPSSEALRSYAGIHNNRFWDIIRDYELTSDSTDTTMLADFYWELRTLIPDAEAFIDDNFAQYINKTGAILYNYDYELKYISYGQVWDNNTQSLVSNVNNKLSSFLYGTRLNSIRTWFKKRINFLDSVYYEKYPDHTKELNDAGVKGYYFNNKGWGARLSAELTNTTISLTGSLKYKVSYLVSSDSSTRDMWVSEEPSSVQIMTLAGNNTMTLYGFDGITEIPQFYNLAFIGLTLNYQFEMLKGLYTLGLSIDGLSSYGNLMQCPNLQEVNFSKVKTGLETVTLNLENNLSIRKIDISESDIASLQLSQGGSIEEIDMTGASNIRVLPTTINGQSGLKKLLLRGTSITLLVLKDLPSLERLELPEVIESLTILNCNISNMNYTWRDTSKLSNLQTIVILDCDKLQELSLSGQNNLSSITLLRCPNVRVLNFDNINKPQSVTIDLANTRGGIGFDLDGLTELESLNISKTSVFTSLNLRSSTNLSSLNCSECSGLSRVECAFNYIDGSGEGEDNPIELDRRAFLGCSSLIHLYGYFSINGDRIFLDCISLMLDQLLKENLLKFKFNNANLEGTFQGCKGLTDGTLIINLIHSFPSNKISNVAYMFAGSGANFMLSDTLNIFEAPNKYESIVNMSHMFADTYISGSVFSEGENTPGFFTYIPNVINIEGLFMNTSIEYIDNDIFLFKGMSKIIAMDYIFQNCKQLRSILSCKKGSCIYEEEPLHSRTIFNKITERIGAQHGEFTGNSGESLQFKNNWIWPYGVFDLCHLKMQVDLDDNNNPYLFNTPIPLYKDKLLYIDEQLYSGLTLIIDSENCDYSLLFKLGIRTFANEELYVPKFVRITHPFSTTTGMVMKLETKNGESFFNDTISSLYYPFQGTTLANVTTIPISFFKGCSNLKTAQGVFSGLGLNNVYKFINKENYPGKCTRIYYETTNIYTFKDEEGNGLFDPCISLEDITEIFSNCPDFRMQLYSEMFKNCKLKLAANAFLNSRIIGTLPEKLFYCKDSCDLQVMTGIFKGCYNLGYDENYEYAILPIANGKYTKWEDHIPEVSKKGKLPEFNLPHDLFHYCSINPKIDKVLADLFWRENTADMGDIIYENVYMSDVKCGLTCKIPEDIFNGKNIKNSTELTYVFANTDFMPYGDYIDKSFLRQLLYPLIFKYCHALRDITGMFAETEIPATHVINSNLFIGENGIPLPLENLSRCWYNCQFNPFILLDIVTDENGNLLDPGSSQLESYNMFNNLIYISNISYMFAGSTVANTGLQWPDSSMFSYDTNTLLSAYVNIDGVFAYSNISLGKTVPIFTGINVSGNRTYLLGINKEIIGNEIPLRLWPQAWIDALNL